MHGTRHKITACTIKARAQLQPEREALLLSEIKLMENILATRLPKEKFSYIYNAYRTFVRPSVTNEEIHATLVSFKKIFIIHFILIDWMKMYSTNLILDIFYLKEHLFGPKNVDELLTQC